MSDITRLTNPPTTQTQLIQLMRERESKRQSRQQEQPERQPENEARDETTFHIDEYA